MEESFELKPRNMVGVYVAVIVLSSSEADGVMKKRTGKRGIVYLFGTWGFKVILLLLTKMVEIYLKFTSICFRGPSLKWAFLGL